QRATQGGDHLGALELDGYAGSVGLRGDDEIVVGARATLRRYHFVQQEAEIIAKDHQRHGALVHGVAGLTAGPRLPTLAEERLQRCDLLGELGGRRARERHLVPQQRGSRRECLRRQPGRLRVVHVGDDEYGGRVLVEAVGHLVEREAYILQADFLAHD